MSSTENQKMPTNVCPNRQAVARRFTTLDGMIVVASVAIGLAVDRWVARQLDWSKIVASLGEPNSVAWFATNMPDLLTLAMPVGVSSSLGVLALRLRPTRPRWRHLVRQPGLVASLALVLAWAVAAIFTVAYAWLLDSAYGPTSPSSFFWHKPELWMEAFTFNALPMGGFAVGVAWATQSLLGRWRAEPSWIDRLGRVIGATWVLLGIVGWGVVRAINL